MTYRFIFSSEPKRIISATILDARFTIPAIQNGSGFDAKAYVDLEIARMTENTLLYKIETDLGGLAGYFMLLVTNIGQTVTKINQVLRPAFQSDTINISNGITQFINASGWEPDILL